jgi:hypothetical protein
VRLDAVGQAVIDRGDFDLGLEHPEAPLDVGQGIAAPPIQRVGRQLRGQIDLKPRGAPTKLFLAEAPLVAASGQMVGWIHALVQNAHTIDTITGAQVANDVFAGRKRAQAWPQFVAGLAQSGTGSQICTRVADRSEVATGVRTTPGADGVVPGPLDIGSSLWSEPVLSHLSSRLPRPR